MTDTDALLFEKKRTSPVLRTLDHDGVTAPSDSVDYVDFVARRPTELSRVQDLPPFPVAVLPPAIADMVSAVACFTQTDPGMAGAVALATIAAVAGGRVDTEVRLGWREPSNIWPLAVANPAERKSAVQAALAAPVFELERELVEKARPTIAEAANRREIAERISEQARKVAGSAALMERDAATRAALDAARAVDDIAVPALPRLVADDVTPEAMTSLLADQGGRLAIISTEGGIFGTIGGRYNGNVPNLDAWLKAWSGDQLRVDRKGRDSEFIERPALTVCVMVQPAVLTSAGRLENFRGSGLLARFLYVVPTSTLGSRDVDPPAVPGEVATRYSETIITLGRMLAELPETATLKLEADADEVRLEFARAIEPRIGADGDLEHIADWAGKIVGTSIRLAGLLHLAGNPGNALQRPISAETMRAGVSLAEFFIPHALSAFDMMDRTGDDLGTARKLLGLIRRRSLSEFSASQIHKLAGRTWLPDQETTTAVLDTLVDFGWIVPLAPELRTGPGRRPSPRYRTHPAVFRAESYP